MSVEGISLNKIKNQKVSGYPEVITSLPEAETAIEGARAWILQSDMKQMVFCEFTANLKVPKHSHSYPQWGIVIEGSLELQIDGKLRLCGKGDEYLIPAGATHAVTFIDKTRVLDLFSEKNRYSPKSTKLI
jgi:quercetin dioxygenase-like cupin family protein